MQQPIADGAQMQLTVGSEKSAILSKKCTISVQICCPYPAHELYIIVDVTSRKGLNACQAAFTNSHIEGLPPTTDIIESLATSG
jgi:hypothetical protein